MAAGTKSLVYHDGALRPSTHTNRQYASTTPNLRAKQIALSGRPIRTIVSAMTSRITTPKGRRLPYPARADGHMTILIHAQQVDRVYLSLTTRKNKRPVAPMQHIIVLLLLPSPTSRAHHCYNPPGRIQPKRFPCRTNFYHRR